MTPTRPNRRQLIKKAGAIGALAAVLSPSSAFAQTTSDNTQSPEGAWLTTITLHNPNTVGPFQGLMTFAAGGGLVDTEQIDLANGGTPGIGSWASRETDTFALKFYKLAVDNQGNLLFTVRFRLTGHLIEDQQAFTSSGTFDGTDPTGKMLFSGTVQMRGTRIQ